MEGRVLCLACLRKRRRLREERREKGLCWCGAEKDNPLYAKCAGCRRSNKASVDRWRAKNWDYVKEERFGGNIKIWVDGSDCECQ